MIDSRAYIRSLIELGVDDYIEAADAGEVKGMLLGELRAGYSSAHYSRREYMELSDTLDDMYEDGLLDPEVIADEFVLD